MKKRKKNPFYSEYMVKKWTKPPRFICGSFLKQQLGIISPALFWGSAISKSQKEILKKYLIQSMKYQCYKKKLTKSGWKVLRSHVAAQEKEKK